MQSYKREIVFTPKDEKKHFSFPFLIEGENKVVRISFSYFPKVYEDRERSIELLKIAMQKYTHGKRLSEELLPLTNYLSLSVDSPDRWLGTAHRGANEQTVEISEEKATYGFYPSVITEGEWKITLSTDCLLSDKVTVLLEVTIE